MKFLVQIIISALAVMVTQYILPGIVVDTFFTGIMVALILGLFNTVLRPILVLLTLPITVVTLGFFLLVINAFLIMATASLVDGFHVSGFWSAVFFSLILSFVTSVFNGINERENGR
jgi:putative membrane protein